MSLPIRGVRFSWLLSLLFFVGCTQPQPASAPPAAAATPSASAPAAKELASIESPSVSQAMSCGSLTCNPNSGGTAYCRRVLQEPTAWCVKWSSTGLCCYP